ncbi:hypothetical protein CWT12_04065 [Actinomyces sp. 432]|nr:hypothetical protein CWT12_04065 [Actinomyces sp. 432]
MHQYGAFQNYHTAEFVSAHRFQHHGVHRGLSFPGCGVGREMDVRVASNLGELPGADFALQ